MATELQTAPSHGNRLSKDEQIQLENLEYRIRTGLKQFLNVGAALLEVRDRRLYRDKYTSFEEYCREEWDLTKTHANRLALAATVVEEITETGHEGPMTPIGAISETGHEGPMTPIGVTSTPDSQQSSPDCQEAEESGDSGNSGKPERSQEDDAERIGPTHEAQVRALAKLPKGQRKAAWEEAVAESGGKAPTGKTVEEVVTRRLADRPKRKRHAEPPKSNTTVNGVAADDPPEIRRMRERGIIAPDAQVEVTEPEADETPDEQDSEPEGEAEESEPAEDELSDEQWLATLPLSHVLSEQPLRIFQADALNYRRMQAERKRYQTRFRRERKAIQRLFPATPTGSFTVRILTFLSLEHPRHWHVCPPLELDGCGGTGQVPAVGKCAKCYGGGYLLKT